MSNTPSFGKEFREEEFTLTNGVVYTNHGSYGMVPKRIQEAQIRILREMYDYPDLWWRYNLRQKMDESRATIAEFVNADKDDIVFVQNATTGITSVMKSLQYSSGDTILCTEHTYQAVKYICSAASELNNEKEIIVEHLALNFPINNEDEVVEMYRNFFIRNPKTKVAVIDHITSPSAIRMPIEKLIPLCKEFGVISVIDGAHAPGQIPLDIESLDPDFYAGILHKWLYTPKGCAFLYIKKKYQDLMKPVVVSHGYKKGLQNDYFHQGVRDDSPYIAAKEAVHYYNSIGGHKKLFEYIDPLLTKAVDLLTKKWGTKALQIPKSMQAPFMRMVQLPKIKVFQGRKTFDELEPIIIDHIRNHQVTCQYTYVDNTHYVRVSCNVYNTEEDYVKLGEFIYDLSKQDI